MAAIKGGKRPAGSHEVEEATGRDAESDERSAAAISSPVLAMSAKAEIIASSEASKNSKIPQHK